LTSGVVVAGFGEQMLESFRKELEGVDLRPAKKNTGRKKV